MVCDEASDAKVLAKDFYLALKQTFPNPKHQVEMREWLFKAALGGGVTSQYMILLDTPLQGIFLFCSLQFVAMPSLPIRGNSCFYSINDYFLR